MSRWWETFGNAYDSAAGPAPGRPDATPSFGGAMSAGLTSVVFLAIAVAALVMHGDWREVAICGGIGALSGVLAIVEFRASLRRRRRP